MGSQNDENGLPKQHHSQSPQIFVWQPVTTNICLAVSLQGLLNPNPPTTLYETVPFLPMTSFDALSHLLLPDKQSAGHADRRDAINIPHLARGTNPRPVLASMLQTPTPKISTDSRSASWPLLQSDTHLSASARGLAKQARPNSLPARPGWHQERPPVPVSGPSTTIPRPPRIGRLPCLVPSLPRTDNSTTRAGNMSALSFFESTFTSHRRAQTPRKEAPALVVGDRGTGRGPGYSETVAL